MRGRPGKSNRGGRVGRPRGEITAELCCCLSKSTLKNPAGEGGAKTCDFLLVPTFQNAFALGGQWIVLVGPGHDPDDAGGKRLTPENQRFRVVAAFETVLDLRNELWTLI